eukprot:753915-Hanusia_phi.AAC.2
MPSLDALHISKGSRTLQQLNPIPTEEAYLLACSLLAPFLSLCCPSANPSHSSYRGISVGIFARVVAAAIVRRANRGAIALVVHKPRVVVIEEHDKPHVVFSSNGSYGRGGRGTEHGGEETVGMSGDEDSMPASVSAVSAGARNLNLNLNFQ